MTTTAVHPDLHRQAMKDFPTPYPPPLRDDAIMMASLARIEIKLNMILAKLGEKP